MSFHPRRDPLLPLKSSLPSLSLSLQGRVVGGLSLCLVSVWTKMGFLTRVISDQILLNAENTIESHKSNSGGALEASSLHPFVLGSKRPVFLSHL